MTDSNRISEDSLKSDSKGLATEQELSSLISNRDGYKNLSYLSHVKGIALAILSAVCYATMAMTVTMNININPLQISFVRYAMLSCCWSAVVFKKVDFKSVLRDKKTAAMVCLRSILGSSDLICMFYSFQLANVGDASAIIFMSPLFTLIFGKCIFKDTFGIFELLVSTTTVVGAIFIAHPDFLFGSNYSLSVANTIGLGIACASCFLTSVTLNVLQYLKHVDTRLQVSVYGTFGMLITTIVCTATGNWNWQLTLKEIMLLLSTGATASLALITLTLSFQYEKAQVIAVIRCCEIVFAYGYQIFLFHQTTSPWSYGGATLIVCSVLILLMKRALYSPSNYLKMEDENVKHEVTNDTKPLLES